MISKKNFLYVPGEHEAEKASNSYLMSMVALIAALPLPVINLIATVFFYLANKKGTYFVRWHCTQALFSQLSLFPLNSFGFWWTVSIVFSNERISNNYIAYILTLIIVNLAEFIAIIYTAIKTRKGIHIEWWFYGILTQTICRP